MAQGIFITLEGGEGAGKSTLVPALCEALQGLGFPRVHALREPGGTPAAEEIRAILKAPREGERLLDTTELLLMYAARAQLVGSLIRPALSRGEAVVCDRFDLSTLAYQGGGRQIPLGVIAKVREVAIGGFAPDLTLLLDLPVEQGMARARGRGAADRFELEQRPFFERVRAAYLDYAKAHPGEVEVVDASRGIGAVRADAVQRVTDFARARALA
ncbi:MAG: dTMP kinase [Succinivibrionaceae bacterium]|nr:dTMP kinase [Succinivibrionaceae bacterium]